MELAFHYYFVRKLDSKVLQHNNSNVPSFSLDNDEVYSFQLDGYYDVCGKFHDRATGKFYTDPDFTQEYFPVAV